MQPTAAAPRTRPISLPDEDLRVYAARPRRSIWATCARLAADLALGVALGTVAWEAYAAASQTKEPAAPAALPARTEPNAPAAPVVTLISATVETTATAPRVDAIPLPQAVPGPRSGIERCPPATAQAVSTRPATASIKSQPVPTSKPSPAPEPEFNEDF